jgi:hypothetical protein
VQQPKRTRRATVSSRQQRFKMIDLKTAKALDNDIVTLPVLTCADEVIE